MAGGYISEAADDRHSTGFQRTCNGCFSIGRVPIWAELPVNIAYYFTTTLIACILGLFLVTL